MRHATDQRVLPQPPVELPLRRDPAPPGGLRGCAPRRPGDRPRRGRRHPAAAARGDRRHSRGRRGDGAPRELPGLRSLRRLRVPALGDRGPRLRAPWRHAGPRRDLRQRRRQERQRESPGDLRRRLRRGLDGSGLSRLRRQQRRGRALGQGRRRAAATPASSICPARRRTTFSPPCPIGASISSISAIPTIPPARWRRGRRWRAGSRGRGPTTR